MPITSRREIETVLAEYQQLSYAPPKESQSLRLVNEVLMRIATIGPLHNAVGETVVVPLRGTVPAIASSSLLPKNATRACAASKWFCDIAN